MEKIRLLHTNDLHSHLENWPQIVRFLHQEQDQFAGEVFTFDIGDAIDRLHPMTEASLGQDNIQLMNEAHYRAVTIGNNEGLGLNHEQLNVLYEHANFDVLLANLLEKPEMQLPKWAKPYAVYQSQVGTKVGVIGMTAPYGLTYPLMGWQPEDVDQTLDKYLPELRQESDVVVLLSHLGLPTDRRLAQKYDLDVILGAHTHHVLPEGEMVAGTILGAAGRYGDHVGVVDLELDDQHQVQAKSARAIPAVKLPVESHDLEEVRDWLTLGKRQLRRQVVTHLPAALQPDQQAQDALAALSEFLQVSAAMVSTGMFVETLPAGPLSRYELLESMPHSVNPTTFTLTGAQLKTLLAEIRESQSELLDYPMKGSGFRGRIFGKMVFKDLHQDPASGQVYYQGKAVSDQENYQLAALDHYKWISFFPVLNDVPVEIHLDLQLRELMADYYQQKYGPAD
ncbi:metallophosphoesterase [Leuconostocaceae bacterium ESL0723]|nr:metallophosphoesterase [Leuconostocaceae bacterium ESL0723]